MAIKLNGSTSGSVALDAPADTSPSGTDVTLTLPTSAGSSGQYLQTNGSGTLSWQTVEGLPDAIDVNASAPADSVAISSGGGFLVNSTTSRTNVASLEPRVQIEGTNNDTSTVAIISNNDSDGTAAQLHLCKSSTGTVGSNGAVVNNEVLGRVSFDGSDGTDFIAGAQVLSTCEANAATNAMTANLRFYVNNGGSFPSERMRIASSGYVEIGQVGGPSGSINTTGFRFGEGSGFWWSTTGANSYWNTNTNTNWNFRRNGSQVGSIFIQSTSTSYNTSSDYRMKENVVDLDGAITRVKQLAPKRFNFIATPELTVDGFLAHEAQAIVPEAVTGIKDEVEVWTVDDELPDGVLVGDNKLDEDGNTIPKYQGIDQAKLVPLLTAALQEAIAKIETLETANASQAATIAALDARLTALEGGAA